MNILHTILDYFPSLGFEYFFFLHDKFIRFVLSIRCTQVGIKKISIVIHHLACTDNWFGINTTCRCVIRLRHSEYWRNAKSCVYAIERQPTTWCGLVLRSISSLEVASLRSVALSSTRSLRVIWPGNRRTRKGSVFSWSCLTACTTPKSVCRVSIPSFLFTLDKLFATRNWNRIGTFNSCSNHF